MHINSPEKLVYPTAVSWPAGLSEAGIVDLLVEMAVGDIADVRFVAGRTPPLIMGCFDPAFADAIVTNLLDRGGDAFAPSLADIARLGPSLKIRDLRLVHGKFELDLYAGPSTVLRREQIQFLVRGSVRESEASDRAARVARRVQDALNKPASSLPYGHAIRSAARRNAEHLQTHAAPMRNSEKLDIHATDGTVYQVDGDKFAFGVLGDMKGHADKPNMDALCDLIAHVALEDAVDTYFTLFRPPPNHGRLARLLPHMTNSAKEVTFSFYSRWAALVYRHVLRAPAPRGSDA